MTARVRRVDFARCRPSSRRAGRATCCPTRHPPGPASSASPRTSPRATATGRSRRRCSSRRACSSAASARSPTSSRRSCSGSRRGRRRASRGRCGRSRPRASSGRTSSTGCRRWPQPVKLTMTGPMFRYDRPQAGRYRQFWQFDVEAIGDPGPAVDAEIIELANRFYAEAGLRDVEGEAQLDRRRGVPSGLPRGAGRVLPRPRRPSCRRWSRHGSSATRCACWTRRTPRWRSSTRAPRASPTGCARRARPTSRASARTSTRWASGTRSSHTLVRGLDYYTRTAFEFYSPGARASSRRWAAAAATTGSSSCSAGSRRRGSGSASGIDRVVLALDGAGRRATDRRRRSLAVVVGADPDDTVARLRIATDLRAAGLAVRADLAPRKLGRQLEGAGKDGAHFAVIVGDELEHGQVQLRDLRPAASTSSR